MCLSSPALCQLQIVNKGKADQYEDVEIYMVLIPFPFFFFFFLICTLYVSFQSSLDLEDSCLRGCRFYSIVEVLDKKADYFNTLQCCYDSMYAFYTVL